MCGIALIVGEGPDPGLFRRMLLAIEPRGEVTETICEDRHLMGARRLKIVDRDRAVQPWTSADGRYALCYNGEVYNFRSLQKDLEAAGHRLRSDSDTEVVLESFLEWGDQAVERLRGEFAFAVVDREADEVYLARDPLGVKPLYLARAGRSLLVASEVKALVPASVKVSEIPPGHHGWADATRLPRLAPYSDLLDPGDGAAPVSDPDEAAALLRSTLQDSFQVRLDTDLTVGVALSGGLDSTLTLIHVSRLHPDCVAFTVGTPGSEDVEYARRVASDLGVHHEVVELLPKDIRLADVKEAVRQSELSEYGDVINAVVTRPLFERVRACGVKVVLVGDGSDELFGGYDMYRLADPSVSGRLFRHKLANLGRTELQRVDRLSMGHGVEARVPYLDPAVVRVAMQIPVELKVRGGEEKWILRRAFSDVLPDYIRARRKNPMSHASGLHERVRLYRPLFSRLHRSYGYELNEPMRRDFSVVLAHHELDLDRALASDAASGDYTPLEQARDLAGAIRGNLLAWRATGRRRASRSRTA
jgi:asparagine synthase (glutamine-hydrolysing)